MKKNWLIIMLCLLAIMFTVPDLSAKIEGWTEALIGATLNTIDTGTKGDLSDDAWWGRVDELKTNKLDATVAPDEDNDTDESYEPGSVWVDVSNDKSYICLDATDGAAVWGQTNLTASAEVVNEAMSEVNFDGDTAEAPSQDAVWDGRGLVIESSAPTAAAGKVVHDTTVGQLLVGAVPMVLHPDRFKNAIIESLDEDTDNYEIMATASYPITIRKIGVHCEGDCSTPGTFTFKDRAGNALTVGAITVSTGTGNTTFATVSAGGSFAAGEGLLLTTSNTPTTGDKYSFIIEYRVDRQ